MVTLLLFLGAIAFLAGWLWIVVIAFSESVLWGVLILLIPITALVFIFLNWEEVKLPGSLMIGGMLCHILGRAML